MPRANPALRFATQVRLTEPLAEMVQGRADRLGVSQSEAIRQLLELAGPLELAERFGLVIAPDVVDAEGWAGIAWASELSEHQVDALPGLSAAAAAQLRAGAVLLTTPETAMALHHVDDQAHA